MSGHDSCWQVTGKYSPQNLEGVRFHIAKGILCLGAQEETDSSYWPRSLGFISPHRRGNKIAVLGLTEFEWQWWMILASKDANISLAGTVSELPCFGISFDCACIERCHDTMQQCSGVGAGIRNALARRIWGQAIIRSSCNNREMNADSRSLFPAHSRDQKYRICDTSILYGV